LRQGAFWSSEVGATGKDRETGCAIARRRYGSPYNTTSYNKTAPAEFNGRRRIAMNLVFDYFVQKVARPWHVVMPPSAVQR
jgi:hypothetical protein